MRVVCSDGTEVRIPKRCVEKIPLFKDPDIVRAGYYTVNCGASSQAVNILLDHIDDGSELRITNDNWMEIKVLCSELRLFETFWLIDSLVKRLNGGESPQKPVPPPVRPVKKLEKHAPPPARRVKEFIYIKGKPWDGIIAYLTRKFGGNIHNLGVVHVMGFGSSHSQVVDFSDDRGKYSNYPSQHSDPWIGFDFNEWRVNPTTYTLRSSESPEESPKSWVLEASNDGYSWREIDRRTNNDILNAKLKTVTFTHHPVPEEESFRFFRIRLTGLNRGGSPQFSLRAIEFFGTLFMAQKERQPRPIEFVYQADKEGQSPPPLFLPKLDGIIAHLTLECGGNVYEKGIINVMATGHWPTRAVDLDSDEIYVGENEKDSFICYDFGNQSVIPRSYSLKSYIGSDACPHLRSWVIEVSNDGYSWTEIDRRVNSDDLNGRYMLCNFKISRVLRESFRLFRLRVIGPNNRGDYRFALQAMEIFGTLIVVEKTKRPQLPKQEFVYHADKEGQSPPPLFPPKLDGIIAHLTFECGGNVHDKGIVNILGIVGDNDMEPKWAADVGMWRGFASDDVKDAWLEYDFRTRRVMPTGYSLLSCYYDPPKSWVVEVSNDGSSWKIIDRQNDTDVTKSPTLAHFKVSCVPRESYRFLRIRQTGRNHKGTKELWINAFEIFGTLYDE